MSSVEPLTPGPQSPGLKPESANAWAVVSVCQTVGHVARAGFALVSFLAEQLHVSPQHGPAGGLGKAGTACALQHHTWVVGQKSGVLGRMLLEAAGFGAQLPAWLPMLSPSQWGMGMLA